MRWNRIAGVALSVAMLGGLAAAPALAKDRNVDRIGTGIAREWETWNPGGAPVSPEFVTAALEQGLTAKQVLQIFTSQALGGAQTSATFSSPELLDHFTENPDLIPALLSAVESVRTAPRSYAEYLVGGGTPGAAYRSHNQLLQEAVLGITGAREAYLRGTSGGSALDRIRDRLSGSTSSELVEDGIRQPQGGSVLPGSIQS
jgi:hypothetical protein